MTADSAKPAGAPPEVLARVLDASAALLASERASALGLPDDELHREILLPLLPAMLGDAAIRQHWLEQSTAGFLAALRAHLQGESPAPRWTADDLEIHVTASYCAGADARALADTLLSEVPLRALAAEVLNRALDVVWAELPRAEVVVETTQPAESALEVAEVLEVQTEVDGEPPPAEIPEAEPEPDIDFPVILPDSEPVLDLPGIIVSPFSLPAPILPVRIRFPRRNPLAGSSHTFGGMGAPDWRKGNPLESEPWHRRVG